MTDTTIDVWGFCKDFADRLEAAFKIGSVDHERTDNAGNITFRITHGRGKASFHVFMARKKGEYGIRVPTVRIHGRRHNDFQPRKDGTHNIKLIINRLIEIAKEDEARVERRKRNQAKGNLRHGMLYAMSFLTVTGEKMIGTSGYWSNKACFIGRNGTVFHMNVNDEGLFQFGFMGSQVSSPSFRWDRILSVLRHIDDYKIEPNKEDENAR